MNSIEGLLYGFLNIMNVESILFCLLGVIIGIFVGALPGLGPSAGVAILLPITFGMSPSLALIMLCGIYYGAMFGGAIPAVLLNIPGDSAAIITALEGNKLAKKGKGGSALGIAILASVVGGTIGTIILSLFAPNIAQQALKFGPAEMFSVIVLAFIFVASQSDQSLPKSMVSLFFGLLMSIVGMDMLSGIPRLTFGQSFLMSGLDITAVIIGFFALAETMIRPAQNSSDEVAAFHMREVFPTKAEIKRTTPATLRGTIIGFLAGVMPGSGATSAAFMSYGVEKKFTKRPEDFGNGSMEAVASAESANNAAAVGAMVPLMSLAIPGSATTAILLSGFIMFGLEPGPQLFIKHADIAWGLIASMYIGNLLLVVLSVVSIPFFIAMIKKAMPFIIPLVVTVSVAGVYSINNMLKDVWIMIICGLISYVFSKLNYPLIPALLGLVLGPMAESNLRRALEISDGSMLIFLEKPICLVFTLITVLVIVLPAVLKKIKARRTMA